MKYILDSDFLKGLKEVFQTSKQVFFNLRGDCEDHAILLADWLIETGYDARVVAGYWGIGGHAWVVLFLDAKEYIIEATGKRQSGFTPLLRIFRTTILIICLTKISYG